MSKLNMRVDVFCQFSIFHSINATRHIRQLRRRRRNKLIRKITIECSTCESAFYTINLNYLCRNIGITGMV